MKKHWYLVQWHATDEKRVRLVSKALFDGYHVADRLLEGCMFVVSVSSDGLLTVDAATDTADYIQNRLKASVSTWNNEVLAELEKHHADNLDAYAQEDGWMDSDVSLTDDLTFYLEKGIVVEWYHTYPKETS